MIKDEIKIRIKIKDKTKALLKLHSLGIYLKNIVYLNDALECIILKEDLKRIKKYMVSYKVEVVEVLGKSKIKQILKKNMLYFVGALLAILLFFVLSNIIVKINIVHESKELRTLISDALEEHGVTRLSFKKSYDEYEAIIEDIKNTYKDKIEWLEIDVRGMVIYVRVEERIMNHYTEEAGTCHIVASKDGTIKKVLTQKGVSLVALNKHVKKGDILISGEIKLNDEIKENVCAQGEVYADVWYNAHVTLPLTYEEKKETGKMRYNLSLKTENNNYVIFKSRVDKKEVVEEKLFKILGSEFYLLKEYEVKVETKTYQEEEAIAKALELVKEKLRVKDQNAKVIEEKVLKKSINNGNLDIDIFIVLEEQIGLREEYIVRDSGNDEIHNGDTNGGT